MANPMTSTHHVIDAIAAVVVTNYRVLSKKTVDGGLAVVNTSKAIGASAMTARIAYSFLSIPSR